MFWCKDTEGTGIYKLQKRFMKIVSGAGKKLLVGVEVFEYSTSSLCLHN
jgi:hypothetical protein